jgi:CMP-N-acetylneuraminic acid synthetase
MLKSGQKFVNEDTLPYVMSSERSVDIDTLFDARIAEMYLKENENVQNRK